MKKVLQGLLIGVLAAVAAILLWFSGVLTRWEGVTWNWRARVFAKPVAATDQIKVIFLDQSSLDWGAEPERAWPWPWPRIVYSVIVDYLKRFEAKAVIFDVVYSEPSTLDMADELQFADAIARAGNFVGALYLGNEITKATNWPADIPAPKLRVENAEVRRSPGGGRSRWQATGAAFPIPEIATNAFMLGNVQAVPDTDGFFRSVRLFRLFDGQAVPFLGFAGWLAGQTNYTGRLQENVLAINGREIPLDKRGRMLLRYRGPSGTHQSFSAESIIQSELRLRDGGEPLIKDGSIFKDKYVLFGFSAPGLKDLRPSPINANYPGVEINATLLDNLLEGDFLRNAPIWLSLLALLLPSMLAGVIMVCSRKAWQSVLTLCVFLPIPAGVGFAAYPAAIILPVVGPELAVLMALIAGAIWNFATEGRQKAFIKGAFKYYLSPDVIDQIIENPGQLKLGGEKRELTIFFSDIEKFSSFSERLPADVLTQLLNDFLTDMTDIILEEGGTLDKYIGDAIVAFWNAPLPQPDHALRAVRAALRCQQKLAERRAEFEERTSAVIKMRIGLNTGEVTVGNMGSNTRFNYTILGDAANLASRLEGANKAFGTYMMAAESTWSLAQGHFIGRELGLLRVVGRKTPVRVFEPWGLAQTAPKEWLPAYQQALKLCQTGQVREALEIFEKIPDDPAVKVYVAKCHELLKQGMAPWDGIWNLTEK